MTNPTSTVPGTEQRPVTDDLHGEAVVDQYRWLEGDSSGKVTDEVADWSGRNFPVRVITPIE